MQGDRAGLLKRLISVLCAKKKIVKENYEIQEIIECSEVVIFIASMGCSVKYF